MRKGGAAPSPVRPPSGEIYMEAGRVRRGRIFIRPPTSPGPLEPGGGAFAGRDVRFKGQYGEKGAQARRGVSARVSTPPAGDVRRELLSFSAAV